MRDTDRRLLALVLLAILATAILRFTDTRIATITLAPIAALLARVVAFYFPVARTRTPLGRWPRSLLPRRRRRSKDAKRQLDLVRKRH
ncbi:MAG: hypothetical protein ACXW4P_06120 [Thermoanaerobaculia bacterium]